MTWRAVVSSKTFILLLALLVAVPLLIAAYADGNARMAGKVFGVTAMLSIWVGRDLYTRWRKRRDRS